MPTNLLEVFTNCYGSFGISAAMELAPQAGITHLELSTEQHGGVLVVPEESVASETIGEKGFEDLNRRFQAHGVSVTSANGNDNILDPEGLQRLKNRMRLAAGIGASTFVGLGGDPPPDVRPQFFETLLELGEHAKSLGLTIALETHPGISENAEAMLDTMETLQHDAIRINFDTANILFYNEGINAYSQLEAVMPYVAHVHLKDSRGGYKDWHFPALGDGGAVDFARIGSIANKAGFFGPFSLEIEGIRGEPEPTLKQRHERVARSVEHLRRVGFLDE